MTASNATTRAAGRVVIELGSLEIEHRMLPHDGLEDAERRRRATMVPLVIRNGAMKPIVNYSKDYAMAVVPVEVAYDADLAGVFNILLAAGKRLRAANSDVLADTVIDGITTFGASAMIVRTSTRVKPGRHEGVAAALRLHIKEMFDRQAAGAPRTTLIPQRRADHLGRPSAGQGV